MREQNTGTVLIWLTHVEILSANGSTDPSPGVFSHEFRVSEGLKYSYILGVGQIELILQVRHFCFVGDAHEPETFDFKGLSSGKRILTNAR